MTSEFFLARHIATTLVNHALATGHKLSVNDGDVWVIQRSSDREAILNAMFSTDEDVMRFYKDEQRTGWLRLIYCNGIDVVSDYSGNPATTALLRPIFDYVEAISNHSGSGTMPEFKKTA